MRARGFAAARAGARLALALALCAASLAAGAQRTPIPAIEPASAGGQCVAPPAQMRREHMEMLRHQRDETVHGGIRGTRFSLRGCIDCHAGRATGSVAKADTDFCVSCHRYAAVTIDCFECHSASRPAVARGAPR